MKRLLAAALAAASLAFGAPAIAQTPPNVLVVGQIAEPKALWGARLAQRARRGGHARKAVIGPVRA